MIKYTPVHHQPSFDPTQVLHYPKILNEQWVGRDPLWVQPITTPALPSQGWKDWAIERGVKRPLLAVRREKGKASAAENIDVHPRVYHVGILLMCSETLISTWAHCGASLTFVCVCRYSHPHPPPTKHRPVLSSSPFSTSTGHKGDICSQPCAIVLPMLYC